MSGVESTPQHTVALGIGGSLMAGAGVLAGTAVHRAAPQRRAAQDAANALHVPIHVPQVMESKMALRMVAGIAPSNSIPVPIVGAPDGAIDVARRAAASVVEVSTSGMAGALGSGWVVEPDIVATAAHVVDRAFGDTADVHVHGRRSAVPGQVIARNTFTDVALLHVPGLKLPAVPTADAAISGSSQLRFIGYPGARVAGAVELERGAPEVGGRILSIIERAPLTLDTISTGTGTWNQLTAGGAATHDMHGMSGGVVVDDAGRAVGFISRSVLTPSGSVVNEVAPSAATVAATLESVRPELDAWRAALGRPVEDAVAAAIDAAGAAAHANSARNSSLLIAGIIGTFGLLIVGAAHGSER